MEVGAGTFHPATTLRSLGPDEVWNVAYAQPSRRPTDGRYGETLTAATLLSVSDYYETLAWQQPGIISRLG